MEEKKHVYRQIEDVSVHGELLINLVETFQQYIAKYGSSIRLEQRRDRWDYDSIEYYLEYKECETDEEYHQRLVAKELAQKVTEQKERDLLKKLIKKYFPDED